MKLESSGDIVGEAWCSPTSTPNHNYTKVTPPAVRCVGRFSRLASLIHPYICQYIDIIRCHNAPNVIVLIAEHYKITLADKIKENCLTSDDSLCIASQLTSALQYLHSKSIFSGMIDLQNIIIVHDSKILTKFIQYGLNYVTDDGKDQDSLIGSPYTLSPERMCSINTSRGVTAKDDIWSLGMVFFQILIGHPLRDLWSYKQFLGVITNLIKKSDGSIVQHLVQAVEGTGKLKIQRSDGLLYQITDRCLQKLPSKRATAKEILSLLNEANVKPTPCEADLEEWEVVKERVLRSTPDWVYSELPIKEAFFLWSLCGSRVETLLVKHGVLPLLHPITTTPSVVVNDFRQFGNESFRKLRVKPDVFVLPAKNFKAKMLAIEPRKLLHSFEMDGENYSMEGEDLPVVVKEKDVYYQCSRMKMVTQLVQAFSFKAETLRKMIAKDVPPMIRSAVWTALLGVSEVSRWPYEELDTLSPHSSDRQLEVDIPRCHQYEELMTSPAAHSRLKRLLKAWLLAHPNFVYWQGLDSLAAPFLLLNFENLPNAFACLSAFISKYLWNFFLKDNSPVIQEYLSVFNHLVAYVDADLYNCMKEMDFYPELFAIPWFLTCFAHVLPLHKLFHVWDRLLLGDVHFPLCVGLAVLHQLRSRLIEANFNDAILLFSDLPDLNMEKVIADSSHYYSILPSSCAFRVHGSDNQENKEKLHTMRKLTVSQLKSLDVPRISREDLLDRVEKQTVLLIDVRSAPEFNRGSVVRSINISNPEDGSLLSIQNLLENAQRNEHPICIMDGGRHEVADKFSKRLLREQVCFICVLDGGFEGIRKFQQLLKAN
ncbi:unnamed protein product, partial [Mesorhabditis belari]|uniref:TBC domain-containing protein kinase-like protein n=1 Tax=Mesorhabditis belari TaxID=2138241 RepID=A0AAF3FIW4_9BILA